MANIYDLPNEILLIVVSLLDISDILSLRQTCSPIHAAIQDKSVWISLLQEQQHQIPFVASLREPHSSYILGLDPSVLQSEVLTARRIDRLWLGNRRRSPTKLQHSGNVQLIGLNVFLDRWLLAVYGEGMHLWDLDLPCGGFPGFRCASLKLSKSGFASYTAALDIPNDRILIVLKKHSFTSPFVTLLYDISLVSPYGFRLVHGIGSNPLYSPRHIDPVHNVVLSSHACSIELLDWTKEENPPVLIPTEGENMEELYTAIHDVRLFGSYVIVFKTRSIELHPLPNDLVRSGSPAIMHTPRILKHKFSKTFRSYVISEIPDHELPDVLTLDFVASDVIHGLFHYTAHITSVPTLEVNLTGLNSLSNLIYRQAYMMPFARQDADPVRTPFYIQESSVFESSPAPEAWATLENGISGYISAYCMGPQAMRAAWIERSRGSMLREIVLARLRRPGRIQDLGEVMRIEARVVHDERSYDLRGSAFSFAFRNKLSDRKEDFTHCALGEATGRIVLGNRAGDLFLLDVDK
ncbi:uncharacterized protein BT62DRAFT_1008147 [Guyanagaster necrorhizus]|uniref:F-box domain-containing protein n=1 Tax=Guyanagaster necrorhizus TaxID=856835 RepID=A0A9P7VR69_9AGAR|nr:uncharacterized protein BT62DRAFT_1008147 [Guyanagaster necrorhizus MCA 3950]KAG7444491.1 hypothetical protein BT62DRAFT_1008147 [Guyanagaster necrorhizus MCA 3950]